MATPTVVSFTLQDNDGVKASAPFYLSYNGAVETVDGLIGNFLALGALIDAVTGARIINGHIMIPLAPEAGWKTVPLAGHSVSDTLNLSFSNDDTIYLDTFAVPAVRDTLIDAGGRPILTAAGPIDALADAIAGAVANGYWVNPTGSDLIALVKAFQGVRKHRRQLTARSTVRT